MKNKAVKIGLDVLTYVFIALCLVFVIFTITAKKTDGAINMFGHQARIVLSESMEIRIVKKLENNAKNICQNTKI